MHEEALQKLGRVVGRHYRLVEVLGAGGMATVYRAIDSEERAVAVKLMNGDAMRDPVVHTRFHREARAVARLCHPRFARFIDWGIDHGVPFMVMELVPGQSLDRILAKHRRLAPTTAIRVAIALCELLEVAHSRGLVHRDIKPGNIMVQALGDRPEIKLIDFGIARHCATDFDPAGTRTNPLALTRRGVVLGTPPYVAPEQLRGLAADERADIHAVGVVLYHMLTGSLPFMGAHPLLTACLQLTRSPRPAREHCPELDGELEALVMSCLRAAPEERIASATELRLALSALDEPPAPPSRARYALANGLVLAAAAALAIGITSAVLLGL